MPSFDPRALLSGPSPLTFLLIAVCVAVSLVGFWALRRPRYQGYFVLVPHRLSHGQGWIGALVSHFSHGDLWHLLLNMLALYLFGPKVEQALGSSSYGLLYAASGLAGSFVFFLIRRKNPKSAALGASGAIAGVLLATVVIEPSARITFLLFPLPLPAPAFALLYIALSSFKIGGRDGVAHEAHLGGALAGLGLAGLLHPAGFGPLIRAVQSLIPG